jgi:hypothetical protein
MALPRTAGIPKWAYNPNDLSTLYQDSAGTIPVTAMEQFVGKMVDKSGEGNHAIQPTDAKRLVVSALVNRFTNTQDFSKPNWTTPANWSVDNAATLAPDGTMTGIKITSVSGAVSPSIVFAAQASQSTWRMALKDGTYTPARMIFRNDTTAISMISIQTGSVSGSNAYGSWTVESVANGWKLLTIKQTAGVTVGDSLRLYFGAGTAVTSGLYWYVWHPDFRPSNIGNKLPPYQFVGDTTAVPSAYDRNGFPVRLQQNATNTAFFSNTMDFGVIDRVTLFASVRKLSDAARGMIIESSVNAGTTNGTFFLGTDASVFTKFAFSSRGITARSASSAADYSAPISVVLVGEGNISGDSTTVWVNSSVANNTADQGTGTYGANPLYIGMRAGTGLPFTGHIHPVIGCGALLSEYAKRRIREWLNGAMKI